MSLAPTVAPAKTLVDGSFDLQPVPDGRSVFHVQGWAVGECDGAPASVEVVLLVDGVEQLRGRPFLAWPGVKERYPNLAGADLAGFSGQVDPRRFEPGLHRIEVLVETCGEKKSLGERTFRTLPPTSSWIAVPVLLLLLAAVFVSGTGLCRLSQARRVIRGLPAAATAGAVLIVAVVVAARHVAEAVREIPPGLFAPLANWDGNFYLGLAAGGYPSAPGPSFAFLPLFPAVLALLSAIPGPLELIAALFNLGCFATALVLLRKLYPEQDDGVLFFIALPFAFFHVVVYTEALALLLAVAFVCAVRRRNTAWIVVLGVLAGLCRIPAIALAGFSIEPFLQGHRRVAAVAAMAPVLGLAGWMAWLGVSTGDPLVLIRVQAEFGRATVFHPGVFLDYLSSLPSRGGMVWWEVGAVVTVLAGAAALAKLRRFDEALYSAAVVLIPLFSMRLAAVNRFALAAFPVFVLLGGRLAGSLPRPVFALLVAAELAALVFFAARFGLQYWVG